MIMFDYYTMKIIFMTKESYDFCNLWLMNFMKNVIYDFCNYDKRIMKNIFMTKVLWLLLLHHQVAKDIGMQTFVFKAKLRAFVSIWNSCR